MTRESFIKKWLGNPDKKYTPEFKDEMRDDLDKLLQSQQIDIQTIGDEIEGAGQELIIVDGLSFYGISIAEVHRILRKYGYVEREPF